MPNQLASERVGAGQGETQLGPIYRRAACPINGGIFIGADQNRQESRKLSFLAISSPSFSYLAYSLIALCLPPGANTGTIVVSTLQLAPRQGTRELAKNNEQYSMMEPKSWPS